MFCTWTKVWVEWLIKFFDLQPSKNPVALGFIGRKRSVDFKKTTLEEFKRIIPSDHYRMHDNDSEIIFHETAKVFCGGLDDPKRIEKFNSANYAFFALNQAEETERSEVGVLKATLRLKIGDKQPPYKALFTANPMDCWLKEDFIDNTLPRKFFIPALYTDNPHLPTNYRATLEDAFKDNLAVLRAYRDGDWFSLKASNALISAGMLNELKKIHIWPKETRRIVVCDPSLGGDECVIYVLENGKVLEEKIMHERDTMKIAGEMLALGSKWDTPNFAADSIGIGQGIYDRIREVRRNLGGKIIAINSAEDSLHPQRFNIRAEMWWDAMIKVQNREIPFPEDEELRRQLCAMRFKVTNSDGMVQMEPKEDTKKRIQRSPDRADAFVMGLWALDQTNPIRKKDAWADTEAVSAIGGGASSAMTA